MRGSVEPIQSPGAPPYHCKRAEYLRVVSSCKEEKLRGANRFPYAKINK